VDGREVTAEQIASIPLFAELARDQQQRVASVCRTVRLRVGEVIVQEGEFAFDFYALIAGGADVVRAGDRVATLRTGDVFGELGVVGAGERGRRTRRRSASVVVTAAGEAIAIEGSEFRRLTGDMPALRDAIHALAAERRVPD
jgi:cAMP-dependent protein kinase regulator/CRP/FNR family cyclic AMP-dependent transcriptional regulator/cGMP-dependent protein kinase 2